MSVGSFPLTRQRRMKKHAWLRELSAEHQLTNSDLILPLFVHDQKQSVEIPSLPGVYRYCLEDVIKVVEQASYAGIKAIMLFPVIEAAKKDSNGTDALREDTLICRTLRRLSSYDFPLGIITDIALDPYTTHSHDGVLDKDGDVDNDATVTILAKQAALHASCGSNIVAPSDMQDGRVKAIRDILDTNNFSYVSIMSYTAKYASRFYGPFREAISAKGLRSLSGSSPIKKDKRTYQLPSSNIKEAITAAQMQIQEGADLFIVKPAMCYLDVVRAMTESISSPVIAYQVSGEYSMLHHLAHTSGDNVIDYMHEACLCAKRAGAQAIISYASLELARSIQQKSLP